MFSKASRWLTLALIFVIPLLFCDYCFAHRLNVFAWVEGDRINVEAKFLGGAKAQMANVELVSAEGSILQKEKTDTDGKASFQLPQGFKPQPLTVVVNAGEGHRNEWKLFERDFSNIVEEKSEDKILPQTKAGEEKIYTQSQLNKALQNEQKRIDSQVVQPLRKALAEAQEHQIGLKEIVGGIGWIVGLFGVLAWYSSRRRK